MVPIVRAVPRHPNLPTTHPVGNKEDSHLALRLPDRLVSMSTDAYTLYALPIVHRRYPCTRDRHAHKARGVPHSGVNVLPNFCKTGNRIDTRSPDLADSEHSDLLEGLSSHSHLRARLEAQVHK